VRVRMILSIDKNLLRQRESVNGYIEQKGEIFKAFIIPEEELIVVQ